MAGAAQNRGATWLHPVKVIKEKFDLKKWSHPSSCGEQQTSAQSGRTSVEVALRFGQKKEAPSGTPAPRQYFCRVLPERHYSTLPWRNTTTLARLVSAIRETCDVCPGDIRAFWAAKSTFEWNASERENCRDWLAVDAVPSELLSAQNFYQGKTQGIWLFG